jgi:hypothetical protein
MHYDLKFDNLFARFIFGMIVLFFPAIALTTASQLGFSFAPDLIAIFTAWTMLELTILVLLVRNLKDRSNLLLRLPRAALRGFVTILLFGTIASIVRFEDESEEDQDNIAYAGFAFFSALMPLLLIIAWYLLLALLYIALAFSG